MSSATKAAALLACLGLLAGCSSSTSGAPSTAAAATKSAPTASPSPFPGMTAGQIWSRSESDMKTAKAVLVDAKIRDGKKLVVINLDLGRGGKAVGFLTLNGHKMTIRRNGKVLYFKADAGFWKTFADAASAKMFTNKWIKVTKGPKAMAQFFEFTEMNYFTVTSLHLSKADAKTLLLTPGITVNGRPTVGLADTPLGQETAQSGTLYVASSGPALPQRMKVGTDGKQFMKFENWNKPVKFAVPPGAFNLDAYIK